MSLVVAHCSTKAIKVVSDTRLTDQLSRLPCKHFDGALKVFLLSTNLGFGFAGDPAPALAILSEWPTLKTETWNFDIFLARLAEMSNDAHTSTEFVAFTLKPAARLCRISNGLVSEGQAQYWIGDQAAFAEYQRSFHAHMAKFPERVRQDPEYIHNQMDPALQAVIESSAISTVGDFLVPVRSDHRGLHYSAYAQLMLFPSTPVTSGEGEWTRLKVGTAAQGAYTICMLTPYESEIPAVAFYFIEGRFGVLFHPSTLSRPKTIKSDDVNSFSSEILKTYGVKLQGQLHIG